MVPTPLFHVTANNCVLHPGTASGAKRGASCTGGMPGRALELIERERVVTGFTGVPTMSREMLLHDDWAQPRHVDALISDGRAAGRPCSPTSSRRSTRPRAR